MPATDIEPLHEEEALGKAYDARLMRRLLRYLRPYRWWVVLGVAGLLVIALLELIGPYLTKVALDDAIPAGDFGLLTTLAAAFLGALVLAFALEYGQQILTTWLGQKIMFDLRKEIFGHLQKQGLAFYDRNPVGRLMTRVTNDVEVLNQLFSSGIVTVFGDVFTLVFIVGVMLWMDWHLALVAFAVMPFVILVAFPETDVAPTVTHCRVSIGCRTWPIDAAQLDALLPRWRHAVTTLRTKLTARFRAFAR